MQGHGALAASFNQQQHSTHAVSTRLTVSTSLLTACWQNPSKVCSPCLSRKTSFEALTNMSQSSHLTFNNPSKIALDTGTHMVKHQQQQHIIMPTIAIIKMGLRPRLISLLDAINKAAPSVDGVAYVQQRLVDMHTAQQLCCDLDLDVQDYHRGHRPGLCQIYDSQAISLTTAQPNARGRGRTKLFFR